MSILQSGESIDTLENVLARDVEEAPIVGGPALPNFETALGSLVLHGKLTALEAYKSMA